MKATVIRESVKAEERKTSPELTKGPSATESVRRR